MAQRHQRGWLKKEFRLENAWILFFRTTRKSDGKRVENKIPVGLVKDFPEKGGFSLLLVVLLISAAWGLRYAIFTAIVATVAYNYFFLPPLFRFTIADLQNWIALFAFLVTAVVASQLSEQARRGMLYADQRRREVERLYSFSQQLWVSENVFELFEYYSQTHRRLLRRERGCPFSGGQARGLLFR
jgi:K+-sensing histidine kinase KdpD